LSAQGLLNDFAAGLKQLKANDERLAIRSERSIERRNQHQRKDHSAALSRQAAAQRASKQKTRTTKGRRVAKMDYHSGLARLSGVKLENLKKGQLLSAGTWQVSLFLSFLQRSTVLFSTLVTPSVRQVLSLSVCIISDEQSIRSDRVVNPKSVTFLASRLSPLILGEM
jgi:hypothetical protein